MVLARANYAWYDFVFFGFALLFVFPDKVVEWINDCTGWTQGRLLSVLLFLASAAAMVDLTIHLLPLYRRMVWWHALIWVFVLGVVRLAFWFAYKMAGYDEDDD